MSSPSFLLANETNHTLLQSVLEALNAIVEHQFNKNPNLVYAILRSKKRFQNLRSFTLESGQEEIERQNQLRKEQQEAGSLSRASRTNSMDSVRSPISVRTPSLSNVPEEHSAFAIGDDDDSEGEGTPQSPNSPVAHASSQSMTSSRAPSVSSTSDETLPLQLRGMSEKARGKMPVGAPLLSRTNSISSLHSLTPTMTMGGSFQASAEWVCLSPILRLLSPK
jgi:hypothetical protein